MIQWYKKAVFENYANFNGRARRAEFWYFHLASVLISFLALLIDKSLGLNNGISHSGGIIGTVYFLAVFIPALAVTVRRLHDIGKSGWLLLIFYLIIMISAATLVVVSDAVEFKSAGPFLISLVICLGAVILLFVLFCKAGNEGENKYGADPKRVGEEIAEIGVE